MSLNTRHLNGISFGEQLARLIDRSGESQTDFAKRAKTSQPVISAICNGRRQCGLRLATKLADALNLRGQDRIAFLSECKKPKWKGFDHELYGPEAVLYDILSKGLGAAGIESKQIQSVTSIRDAPNGNAVFVMRDGSTYSMSLSIRRHVVPLPPPEPPDDEPDSPPVASTAELRRELGVGDTPADEPTSGKPEQQKETPRQPERRRRKSPLDMNKLFG